MTHILGNDVRALSAPTSSATPTSEESGCLCSKCGCKPYRPVGRSAGSHRDVWLSLGCWLTLVSVTVLLCSSCLNAVELSPCQRGQCLTGLIVTFAFPWGAAHFNGSLFIYFHHYISTKVHRDTQAIRSSSG